MNFERLQSKLLILFTLLSLLWIVYLASLLTTQQEGLKLRLPPGPSRTNNRPGDTIPYNPSQSPKKSVKSGCVNLSIIDKVVERHSQSWKKQVLNYENFRALLSSKCHGVSKAVVTQANTPLGSKIVYDGEKMKPLQVTPALFNLFPKESPFENATWDTCSIVGNGGILANSSCGEQIDSAQFVIRCNLPPVDHGYEKDVGNKTNLVTANPSIFFKKFAGLPERKRQLFVDSLRPYDDSLVLLPAFSYITNTEVSLRAFHALKNFGSPARPVFLSPEYLMNLTHFWNSQGLRPVRLSTGLMMASLALELCTEVHLYGFWPFSQHPHDQQQALTNHYYDDQKAMKKIHSMPTEFEHLLRLHEHSILRVHLGQCPPSGESSPFQQTTTQAWLHSDISPLGHPSITTLLVNCAIPTLLVLPFRHF